jgi:dTDP-4-dehydrorhamnose 3,5-epimerase
MKATSTMFRDVLIVEPDVYTDARGSFFEIFNARNFADLGIKQQFVQDNHSISRRNVIRGLHYQIEKAQGKLIRIVSGVAFDVAIDLRQSSPTFGQWEGVELSAENKRMLWIPAGFAHGFLALSEEVEMLYKTTDYYAPEHERTILWNYAELGIKWPLKGEAIVSEKVSKGTPFSAAAKYP